MAQKTASKACQFCSRKHEREGQSKVANPRLIDLDLRFAWRTNRNLKSFSGGSVIFPKGWVETDRSCQYTVGSVIPSLFLPTPWWFHAVGGARCRNITEVSVGNGRLLICSDSRSWLGSSLPSLIWLRAHSDKSLQQLSWAVLSITHRLSIVSPPWTAGNWAGRSWKFSCPGLTTTPTSSPS